MVQLMKEEQNKRSKIQIEEIQLQQVIGKHEILINPKVEVKLEV